MNSGSRIQSLVSVIITSSNQIKYLKQSIESVVTQSWNVYEIIVVDTGIADMQEMIREFAVRLKYFHMRGARISAARNRGIVESNGRYLVFLDARDWLYYDALRINAQFLDKNLATAFVSGSHKKVNEKNDVVEAGMNIVLDNHYQHLLQGNYIETHGAVMYQRWVFSRYRFDDSIDICAEYDLYLKISRHHPVHHHHQYTAIHRVNRHIAVSEIPGMLKSVQTILKRQRKQIQNRIEKQCLENGLQIWEHYYCEEIFRRIEKQPKLLMIEYRRELWLLLKYNPVQAVKVIIDKWFNQEKVYV